MISNYIWEEFKALSKDKKIYQTIRIYLRRGYIDTSNYNRPSGLRVVIEIVNAKNGERVRKIVVMEEEEIANILYWINTKETTISFFHKFKENSTQIYIDKYKKDNKKYYIIRISQSKQDSVSYAFSPAVFRYIMNKIQLILALDSYAMSWKISSNKSNNASIDSLPDNINDNFDEEELPDSLPDDIDF